MAPLNLFEQCSLDTVNAAAVLCGMEWATPAFRSALRGMPRMREGFTVGHVARAYLAVKLAELTRNEE